MLKFVRCFLAAELANKEMVATHEFRIWAHFFCLYSSLVHGPYSLLVHGPYSLLVHGPYSSLVHGPYSCAPHARLLRSNMKVTTFII